MHLQGLYSKADLILYLSVTSFKSFTAHKRATFTHNTLPRRYSVLFITFSIIVCSIQVSPFHLC